MNEKNSIRELIEQARNTRHLVYEIAAAYLGVPPDQVSIRPMEEKPDDSQKCT